MPAMHNNFVRELPPTPLVNVQYLLEVTTT